MVPKRPAASAAAAFTEFASLILVGIATTSTLHWWAISPAVLSRFSFPRASNTRLTPSAARPLAAALPIPILPPTTTAIRPFKPSSMCLYSLSVEQLLARTLLTLRFQHQHFPLAVYPPPL